MSPRSVAAPRGDELALNPNLEVLFSPAEFEVLSRRDLRDCTCVVFDVLRATTTAVTALANGATAVIPVGEIAEALAWRRNNPAVLLAGERDGLRIRAEQTGGLDFDLGNSPREFTAAAVAGREIVHTTTNGTRALRACQGAALVLAAGFVNLRATAEFLRSRPTRRLLLVCSGSRARTAYEDALGAGALCTALADLFPSPEGVTDSAWMARALFEAARSDLPAALRYSWNARRLEGIPELCADVAFCLQKDIFDIVAGMDADGRIRRLPAEPREY